MKWALVFASLACVVAPPGAGLARDVPARLQESAYVGADACKDCHAAIHESWASTPHARALLRLSEADQAGGQCIRCHVTGSPDQIAAEGASPSFPGVQCEACHGAGRAHAAAAAAGTPQASRLVKTPPESACTRCHSEQSPHYSPFFYAAMKGLVHRKAALRPARSRTRDSRAAPRHARAGSARGPRPASAARPGRPRAAHPPAAGTRPPTCDLRTCGTGSTGS